jgi:hypothetical protein
MWMLQKLAVGEHQIAPITRAFAWWLSAHGRETTSTEAQIWPASFGETVAPYEIFQTNYRKLGPH